MRHGGARRTVRTEVRTVSSSAEACGTDATGSGTRVEHPGLGAPGRQSACRTGEFPQLFLQIAVRTDLGLFVQHQLLQLGSPLQTGPPPNPEWSVRYEVLRKWSCLYAGCMRYMQGRLWSGSERYVDVDIAYRAMNDR